MPLRGARLDRPLAACPNAAWRRYGLVRKVWTVS